MASSAPPEPRRFARGLHKPGTAAELRQSVSEAVRTSVLVVRRLNTHTHTPLLQHTWFKSLIKRRMRLLLTCSECEELAENS